jgi:hypothetical protein
MSPRRLLVPSLLALSLLGCRKEVEPGKDGDVDQGDDGGDDGQPEPEPEPLAFSLTGPDDGVFETGASLSVTGTWSGGLDPVLTVNGAASSPAAGDWQVDSPRSAVAWPDSPLWPILAEGADARGVWMRGRRTAVYGDSVSSEAPVSEGLVLRLTDAFLVELEPALDAAVDSFDLDSLLAGTDPVASVLGADLFITGVEFGALVPSFDFRSSGLHYSLRVEDIIVYAVLDAGFLGTTDFELQAGAVIVEGDVIFGVDASGGLTATAANTAVSTEDVELFGITDSFGLVDLLLGDTLSGQVEGVVIDTLGGLLEAQESIRLLELEGLLIESDFTEVNHDEQGVNLVAESRVSATTGTLPPQRLTTADAFSNPTSTETPSGLPYHAGLFLNDDLVSALGAGLVASGLLNQEVSGDLGSISLDTTLLGAIVDGFDQLPPGQPVTIKTRPTVAPVGAVVSTEGVATALHLGGLELDMMTDQDGDGVEDVVMTVVVDAIAGITAGADGALIGVELVESNATLLSTSLDTTPAAVEPGLATLISVAVPALVGNLLGDALTFDLSGITITTIDAGPVGNHGALYLELDPSGFSL